MCTLKSAAWIFAAVFVAVFIVPWVPASASAMTTSALPMALQARSAQVLEISSARVLRADWDGGDRDFHRFGDRDDYGDDDDGGGFFFGGAPYYGYQPYYYNNYNNPYYYQGRPYGFWFNF